jgi:patatin-like phospholipase/acyl hydrolase
MRKILSIDGGGIRGIIPAMVLTEIEARTKKPISALFDLIAGTSTGGILALGLTKPDHEGRPEHSAESLVDLYTKEGSHIFYQSLWRKIHNLGNLLDAKYPAENIEDTLHRYFSSTCLSQALTNVLVPAYEIERRDTFFFKSSRAKNDPKRDFLMKDAARATSAAPTYFQPKKIPTRDLSEYYALVDGGVFANNPAMCAWAEAQSMYPAENDFLVVSLGTGEVTKPIYYNNAINWGVAHWAQPIFNVVLDGVSDAVDFQIKTLMPDSNDKKWYYRFQVHLDEGSDAMDNTDPVYLRSLKLYAEGLIKENSDLIDNLCKILVQ